MADYAAGPEFTSQALIHPDAFDPPPFEVTDPTDPNYVGPADVHAYTDRADCEICNRVKKEGDA